MHRGGKKRQPLTALTVEKLNKPGRYGDGKGLYLAVSNTGAKSWLFLGIRHGARHVVGLGSAGAGGVSLEAARAKASEIRSKLKQGIAPVKARAVYAAARAQQQIAKAG